MKAIIRAVVGIIAALGLALVGSTAATAAPEIWASVPKPVQVDNCGTDNDYFTYTNTGALDYATVENADGTWTITATPKPGYKIHHNTVSTFDYPAFGDGCIVIAGPIPAPTQIDNCGPEANNGLRWYYWSFPQVEGVRWSLVATSERNADGTYTPTGYLATASAAPGYTIDPNTQTTWTFPPFTNTPCG